MKQNIVLVGPPGSGKSQVARCLGRLVGMPFLDLDDIIADTAGKSIPEIFKDHGESGFREIERKVVAAAAQMRKVVIATGGGAWVARTNRERLQENGHVVHLTAHVEELWTRLSSSPVVRPLLQQGFEALQSLVAAREEAYRSADLTVDTTKKRPERVAEEIADQFRLSPDKCYTTPAVLGVKTSSAAYEIHAGAGLLSTFGEMMAGELGGGPRLPRVFVITDPLVKALAAGVVCESLRTAGFEYDVFTVPQGEENKSLLWAEKAFLALSNKGYDRGDVVVSLGGGVVGDLGGFVAALYMRGIDVVQVPTTLLAQVDSSVGGKTAVNLPIGKNLVGAFHQPRLVVSDIGVLRHLSITNLRQGLGECIKYGMIADPEIFSIMEEYGYSIIDNLGVLQNLVLRSCAVKAEIVGQDEKDTGVRMLLNAGHTIGHALEAGAGYGNLSHGEAVGLGLLAEADLSVERGLMPHEDYRRLREVLETLGFPLAVEVDLEAVERALRLDKKTQRGKLKVPLTTGIGRAEIVEGISAEDLGSYARKYVKCRVGSEK